MAYAPDLLDYMVKIGDEKPDEVLADPDFTKRALSEQSPIGLVRIVAKEIAPESLKGVIEGLTAFERSRIFLALGQNDEAISISAQILADSKDKGIQGRVLANLGVLHHGEPNFQEYYKLAIKEGYKGAYGQWASAIFQSGDKNEAIKIATLGLNNGDSLSFAILMNHYLDLEEPKPEAVEPANVSVLEKIQRGIAKSMGWKENDTPAARNRRKLEGLMDLAIVNGINPEEAMRQCYASHLSENGANILSTFMKIYTSITPEEIAAIFGEDMTDVNEKVCPD